MKPSQLGEHMLKLIAVAGFSLAFLTSSIPPSPSPSLPPFAPSTPARALSADPHRSHAHVSHTHTHTHTGAGSWPAVVKTVPATAVTFGVYELVRAALLR